MFLEIGPHSALAGPLRQNFTEQSDRIPYTSALVRHHNGVESLLSAVGRLYTLQVPIDLEALITTGSCLSGLPPYPWDHEESYWYESRLSKDYRLRQYPHHDLLGARIVESTDLEPSWRNLFHLNVAPWVRDHRIEDDIVFPFAGFIAMAGEAVRQATGIDEMFRLRHIIISTALVVPEGKPTELITTLRPHRLTDTLNSEWWEFTIASYNGHTWTKHCTGEVTTQFKRWEPLQRLDAWPRKIKTRKWFDILRRAGLDLGPAFRNLEDISASTTTQQATAKLLNNGHVEADKYHIHPTVVDSALQLAGIAFTNGEARKVKNRLPTSCDYFSIARSSSDLIVSAMSKLSAGSVVADAQGIADGLAVLNISGLKLSAVDNSDTIEANDIQRFARQEWGPDIDFMNLKELVKPSIDHSLYTDSLESITRLCLICSQRDLAVLKSETTHLQRFRQWINDLLKPLDMSSFSGLDSEAIFSEIHGLVQGLADTPAYPAAVALREVCANIGAIFSGYVSSWEDLLTSETISRLYEFRDGCNTSLFIQSLAHCRPNLRVLEIGSWRRSPASYFLECLTLPKGGTYCSKYTFTSKGYISRQENQTSFSNLEYATLDINEDPLEQGFEDQKYDLVISSNAIHTNRSIGTCLKNIRKLLRPDGHLFLQELCPTSKWVNYIFGTHPRWWCGVDDGRLDEPYVDTRRWQHELVSAGYESVGVMAPHSAHLNGIMIAQPSVTHTLSRRVSLLCGKATTDQGPVLRELKNEGYEVVICTIHDPPPPGQDIIALLDRDGPFFENIDSAIFDLFKSFLHNLGSSGLMWVTRLSQMRCQDPRFAQVIGTARTMRSELLIDFATCEVDDIDSSATQLIQVFKKFQQRDNNDLLKPDFEYCICDGVVNVGRFYPFALSDELLTSKTNDRAILDMSVLGRPTTLHWVRKPALQALQPDEVEVDVYAVGLNFRVNPCFFYHWRKTKGLQDYQDVLIAMNIIQLPQGRVFGLEGAGVVRRIGSQVRTLRLGDRVAVVEHNMFATTITTLEVLCVKIPENLSFDEASTMFFPYITAMYSLMDVGGLMKGQVCKSFQTFTVLPGLTLTQLSLYSSIVHVAG